MLTDTDEVVPEKYQRIVVEAYGGKKRLIEKCAKGHNGPLHLEAQQDLEAAMEWLWRESRAK